MSSASPEPAPRRPASPPASPGRVALLNIFNSPTPPRPTRPINPLFLPSSPESDGDGSPGPSRGKKSRLFLGGGEHDDEARGLDAQRDSYGEAMDIFNGVDLDDGDVPQSSGTAVSGRNKRSSGAAGLDSDDEEGREKLPLPEGVKVRAKLDEERLKGPRGFPVLLERALTMKFKGKGHERDDLRRLMAAYQLWTHQVWPKGQFGDTIHGIEKVCKSRSMLSTLRRYNEQLNPPAPEEDPPSPVRILSHTPEAEALEGSASRNGGGEGEEEDLDALISAAQAEQEEDDDAWRFMDELDAAVPSKQPSAAARPTTITATTNDDDEFGNDDEAAWNALPVNFDTTHAAATATEASLAEDVADEDEWSYAV